MRIWIDWWPEGERRMSLALISSALLISGNREALGTLECVKALLWTSAQFSLAASVWFWHLEGHPNIHIPAPRLAEHANVSPPEFGSEHSLMLHRDKFFTRPSPASSCAPYVSGLRSPTHTDTYTQHNKHKLNPWKKTHEEEVKKTHVKSCKYLCNNFVEVVGYKKVHPQETSTNRA